MLLKTKNIKKIITIKRKTIFKQLKDTYKYLKNLRTRIAFHMVSIDFLVKVMHLVRNVLGRGGGGYTACYRN